jgi:hypothetical protein
MVYLADFVSVFFEDVEVEGICGRFGRFGGGSLHIGLLGVQAPMMQVSASLSWPGCPWTAWRGQRLTPDLIRGRCAKVRRQGYAESISGRDPGSGSGIEMLAHFNLRV